MKIGIVKIILLFFIYISFITCKKGDKENPSDNVTSNYSSKAQFKVLAQIGNNKIVWDSLANINEAGNIYSINKLSFYISDITLKRNDGFVYQSNEIFYIEASDSTKVSFQLAGIPNGVYSEISFFVGVDSARNIDLGLNNSADNINMAWPTAMGGGYHFLKMEGHYLNTSGTISGYAIHLGRNENLIHIYDSVLMIQQKHLECYDIEFDVNEIFANPYQYNLIIDPQFTMSDDSAMSKIKNNMLDAFKVFQKN